MGSRWLGNKGWAWKNWLEQSTILCILQRLWYWGVPCPRAKFLCIQLGQLVGGHQLPATRCSCRPSIQVGPNESYGLWLLYRQTSVPSYPTRMYGWNLKNYQYYHTHMLLKRGYCSYNGNVLIYYPCDGMGVRKENNYCFFVYFLYMYLSPIE